MGRRRKREGAAEEEREGERGEKILAKFHSGLYDMMARYEGP